jgi:hypothetical protein
MKPVYVAMLMISALAGAGTTLYAGVTLYKSVDQDGHVTFSDAPTAGQSVESIELPSDNANVLASDSAQALIKEQGKADRQSETSRKTAEASWSDRYQQAQRDVEQAELELEEAQTIQEGDIVGNALGGARPNPAWVERLERAEADLALKHEALSQVRRQR